MVVDQTATRMAEGMVAATVVAAAAHTVAVLVVTECPTLDKV